MEMSACFTKERKSKMSVSLVIMAAGMGSRYGGLKQIDAVDEAGHLIIDFSIYDAVQAGFSKIVFIIKKEFEEEFRVKIGDRIKRYVQVEYVYQENGQLPDNYKVPEDRTKPLGTGHAIWCCRNAIDEPFAVINADDFYGKNAFSMMYQALTSNTNPNLYHMVGYTLLNTLTENGSVSRGVCKINDAGYLERVVERTAIVKRDDEAFYMQEDGETWVKLPADCTVSMNMWGFTPTFFEGLDEGLKEFLEKDIIINPSKSEFFLPSQVQSLLDQRRAQVRVMKTSDRWFGVTYKEDKEQVMKEIERLKKKGIYPEKLWK